MLQVGFGTYKVGFIPASASAAAGGEQQAGGTEVTPRLCIQLVLYGVMYEGVDVGVRLVCEREREKRVCVCNTGDSTGVRQTSLGCGLSVPRLCPGENKTLNPRSEN